MTNVERVAIVQRDVEPTGSLARDAFLLVRELARLGIDVHVYCNPDTRTDELPEATFHDVRPLARSASRLGRAVECASFAAAATRSLRRDRARLAYDVVDVNGIAAWEHDVIRVHEVVRAAQRRWPQEEGAGRRAARARAAAAPLVRPQIGVARSIQARQFRPGRFARALAVSDDVRNDLVDELGVPPELVDVVPLAIDLAEIASTRRNGVRSGLDIGTDEPVVLFVGHAFRRKGLPLAIEALAGLRRDAHLVVVGDGDRDAGARWAAEAGVGGRVHFAGACTKVAPYYVAADLLVLPTSHDPWGIPVVEAMAAGIPVVTTRVAGSAREVEQAGAGIVLTTPSARELRDAVAALIDDPVRRAQMGANGRRAAARFTPRARAELTLEAYARARAEMSPRRRPVRDAPVRRIASFPAVLEMNPYQRLLYDHLARERLELEPDARFALRWLIAERGRVDVLHVHWPESLYTLQRGPQRLRPPLSWAKLVLFAVRLGAARALGYEIAWTIHQVRPHESGSPARDAIAARVLAAASHVLIVHDETSRARAASMLGAGAAHRLALVPHGSYVGVYPPGRPRPDVRRELGIPEAAFVFLSFGELRRGKCWRLAIRAFRATAAPGTALVVAGYAKTEQLVAEIRAEAGGDPRIRLLLEYVAESHVAELFGAADAALVARDDGGTSGSLVLPLSLGVPVVAADCPAYRELTGGEAAGWLFQPGDQSSLRATLERAAADPDEARRRGDCALERARRLRWDHVAARTARLLEKASA